MDQCTDDMSEPARSDEDYDVWRDYLRLVGPGICSLEWKMPAYCRGVSLLAPREDKIPDLAEINAWLAQIHWSAAYNSGFVPAKEYASLQSRRIFPIARHIRARRDFAHSAAPDFIHDLFGHLPMLFEPSYRELIIAWADKRAGVDATPADRAVSDAQDCVIAEMERGVRNEAIISRLTRDLESAHAAASRCASRAGRLDRFYTWCMEFGLIKSTGGHFTVIGAAVLSSFGEMARAMSGQVKISPFDSSALDRPVNYTVYQDQIFSVSDISHYSAILADV